MLHPKFSDLQKAEETLLQANASDGVIFYWQGQNQKAGMRPFSDFDGYTKGVSGATLNAYNDGRRANAIVLVAYHQILGIRGDQNLPEGTIISSLYDILPFNGEIAKYFAQ